MIDTFYYEITLLPISATYFSFHHHLPSEKTKQNPTAKLLQSTIILFEKKKRHNNYHFSMVARM